MSTYEFPDFKDGPLLLMIPIDGNGPGQWKFKQEAWKHADSRNSKLNFSIYGKF